MTLIDSNQIIAATAMTVGYDVFVPQEKCECGKTHEVEMVALIFELCTIDGEPLGFTKVFIPAFTDITAALKDGRVGESVSNVEAEIEAARDS